MLNCGHQDDPGMTGRRLEGVCGSEIGRLAVHAVDTLRLARKMQMHRMGCPDTAADARGYGCTRSLEAASEKFSRRSTRGFEGRLQAVWRTGMPRRSWGGYPRLRLQQWRPRLRPCLLPLRRAGQPAAARMRRPFHTSAHSQAESRHTAAEGRGGGQAGGPLCRLCAPLTRSFASGSTPGVARRRATTRALPFIAAACRGVSPYCRGGGGGGGRKGEGM